MTPALPFFDQTLLRLIERIVPASDREDWSRTWHAELWHMHHSRTRTDLQLDLSIGLIRDALWLRTESCRRAYRGTAALCLATLLTLNILAALLAIALTGSWQALAVLNHQLNRSLFAAPLVIFVAFATSSRRHADQTAPLLSSPRNLLIRLRRHAFLTHKLLLILTLAFLLSAGACQPIRPLLPNTADFFQILTFVFAALCGLRWTVADQAQRCKRCLTLLATPARIGRPSHNLLEWNGTQRVCRHGHGLLSVPEIETSWCQSSHWITQEPAGI